MTRQCKCAQDRNAALDWTSAQIAEKQKNLLQNIRRLEDTENPFVLGKAPVPLFYGIACEDMNTIGGFANWVQDWEYTACLHCGKPMKYLAQIQWDTVMDGTEGTLYVEFCPDCQIVSMQHQQT